MQRVSFWCLLLSLLLTKLVSQMPYRNTIDGITSLLCTLEVCLRKNKLMINRKKNIYLISGYHTYTITFRYKRSWLREAHQECFHKLPDSINRIFEAIRTFQLFCQFLRSFLHYCYQIFRCFLILHDCVFMSIREKKASGYKIGIFTSFFAIQVLIISRSMPSDMKIEEQTLLLGGLILQILLREGREAC